MDSACLNHATFVIASLNMIAIKLVTLIQKSKCATEMNCANHIFMYCQELQSFHSLYANSRAIWHNVCQQCSKADNS